MITALMKGELKREYLRLSHPAEWAFRAAASGQSWVLRISKQDWRRPDHPRGRLEGPVCAGQMEDGYHHPPQRGMQAVHPATLLEFWRHALSSLVDFMGAFEGEDDERRPHSSHVSSSVNSPPRRILPRRANRSHPVSEDDSALDPDDDEYMAAKKRCKKTIAAPIAGRLWFWKNLLLSECFGVIQMVVENEGKSQRNK